MSVLQRKSAAVTLLGAIALVLLASGSLLLQRSAAQGALVDLSGTYALSTASIESQLAARRAVIRRAVRSVDPSEELKWRAALELMAVPEARLRIARTASTLSVSRGTQPALSSAVQGQARTLNDGHRLAQRIEGRALVQRIETSSMQGLELTSPVVTTTRHTLSTDRSTLTVETRIEGGALPQALIFQSTYNRI